MTDTITLPSDLVEHCATELKHQCGGRCNAEYNPCWAIELSDKLRTALTEALAKDGSLINEGTKPHPVRGPSCETCKHCTVASQDSFEETCFICSHYYNNKYEVKK